MPDPRRTTMYGSILTADDGTFWYTCGTWRLGDAPSGIPSILAYTPINTRFPVYENQKTLNLNGVTLAKVSDQPLDIYANVYLSQLDAISARRFGRLVFLDERRVKQVRSPRQFAAPYLANLSPEGRVLKELCTRLGVNANDIGIWGSSLMFDGPVHRHEVDVVVFGRELSLSAYERFSGGALESQDLVLNPRLGLCTAFHYQGVPIDLFFAHGEGEEHPLHGARIHVVDRLRDVEVVIEDATEALFYPAIYVTQRGQRLLSFRPAHARRFFPKGCRIRFDSISQLEITWACGDTEAALGVLDYEHGHILQPR